MVGTGCGETDDPIARTGSGRHHIGTLGIAAITQSVLEGQIVQRLHPRTRLDRFHFDTGRWCHHAPEVLSAHVSVLRPGEGLTRALHVPLDSRQAGRCEDVVALESAHHPARPGDPLGARRHHNARSEGGQTDVWAAEMKWHAPGAQDGFHDRAAILEEVFRPAGAVGGDHTSDQFQCI